MSLPTVTTHEQVQGQLVQAGHIPNQADNDMQAVNLWLHGKGKRTVTAYKKQIGHFLNWIQKPLRFVTLGDLQAYQDHLADSDLKETSQNAYIMTVKSLFSFTQKIGYTTFNPAAAIQGQKVKDELAQRILTEAEVQAMIHLEENHRNKILLRFIYATGARASEISAL
ncbi:MAG: phage integrase N-terminal SAM-like domain-containing protein, partial [Desulfohalobiaceae bacterium]|nr:phage integrase N-terminal SAM-like domain-containing protein [Desulfohalobiaceae bacterium]